MPYVGEISIYLLTIIGVQHGIPWFLHIPRCAPETLEIPSPVWPGNPATGAKRRSGETKILRRETWFRYLERIVLQMDHIVLRI